MFLKFSIVLCDPAWLISSFRLVIVHKNAQCLVSRVTSTQLFEWQLPQISNVVGKDRDVKLAGEIEAALQWHLLGQGRWVGFDSFTWPTSPAPGAAAATETFCELNPWKSSLL